MNQVFINNLVKLDILSYCRYKNRLKKINLDF